MSAIPTLKKKLKSVRTTGKVSKAMKTVAAVKYSRLSSAWKTYANYAREYRNLCGNMIGDKADTSPAKIVIVLGSNRGFCGGFNNDILRFLSETVPPEHCPEHLIVCGEKMARLVKDSGYSVTETFVFEDVPSFASCEPLFACLYELSKGKTDYPVTVIRSAYKNTLVQTPLSETVLLHPSVSVNGEDDRLWLPDKRAVFADIADKSFRTVLFGAVLETALGAQAATLMTMRSAYDTATEYGDALEKQIQRLRQSAVTADVIEIASERRGEDTHA